MKKCEECTVNSENSIYSNNSNNSSNKYIFTRLQRKVLKVTSVVRAVIVLGSRNDMYRVEDDPCNKNVLNESLQSNQFLIYVLGPKKLY